MRFQTSVLSALVALTAGVAKACTNCSNESTEPFVLIPPPWSLKGTIYSITLLPVLDTLGIGAGLPAKAVPPFERAHPNATQGEYKGILGMIQVIRYTESPVGPYDELLM
jgi:hypothetical protein